jgi:hypothetical protein
MAPIFTGQLMGDVVSQMPFNERNTRDEDI